MQLTKKKKIILTIIILVFFSGFIIFFNIPLPKALFENPIEKSTQIFDREGELLYEIRPSDYGLNTQINLNQIPTQIIQALLLTEDSDFYFHIGTSIQAK